MEVRKYSGMAIALACFAICGLIIPYTGLLKPIDNALINARASFEKRQPSGDVVLLAIDSASIDFVGKWPWPRSIYADVIAKLNLHDVQEIAFDIDFSSPSSPGEDRIFADAIRTSQSPVILATFQQKNRVEDDIGAMKYNAPIPEIGKHAWPASVNVYIDELGLVRSVPTWSRFEKEHFPSIAKVLSGNSGSSTTDKVNIDFSINPGAIPVFSLSALFGDKIATEKLSGKSVLIGATAIELRDTLAVPVHQVMAGSMIHIMAAETIKQHRSLSTLSFPVYAFLTVLLLLVYQMGLTRPFTNRVPAGKLMCLMIGVALVETTAYVAYTSSAVVVQTASLLALLIALTVFDITRQLQFSSSKLFDSIIKNRRMKNIINRVVEDNSDAIFIADLNGSIQLSNSKAREMFGADRQTDWSHITSVFPENLVSYFNDIAASTDSKQPKIRAEFACKDDQNNERILSALLTTVGGGADEVCDNEINRFICVTISDRTGERKAQRQIEFLANHDTVTGALTRRRLGEIIDENGLHIAAHNSAILVINIRNLQSIAQLYGINIKHLTLKAVHSKICERFDDLPLARLQDDALALVVRSATQGKISEWANQIIKEFEPPLMISGHQMKVDIGVGAVASWQGFEDSEHYVQAAEMLLNEVRHAPASNLTEYDIKKSLLTSRRLSLENHLQLAIRNREITILYQQQVDLQSRQFVGAEALVRWTQKDHGPVSPNEFIPIAEKSGVIVDIGRYVIEEACREACTWPNESIVSVNVSPVQLVTGDLYSTVHEALVGSGLAANRLCLEITETEFLEKNQNALEMLHRIRRLGVLIAIDDFGTGFSSFEYISRLPIDKLKIDRIFLDAKHISDRNVAVIKSIAELAKGLGFKIICEGIEYEEQAILLEKLGCEFGQGFLFGKAERSPRSF